MFWKLKNLVYYRFPASLEILEYYPQGLIYPKLLIYIICLASLSIWVSYHWLGNSSSHALIMCEEDLEEPACSKTANVGWYLGTCRAKEDWLSVPS